MNHLIRRDLCVLALFLFIGGALAQSAKQDSLTIPRDQKQLVADSMSLPAEEPSLEIDGLLIDETRTKAGHDFYDLLYNAWEAPAGVRNFMIRIAEKPFRVNITQLDIYVNEELVGNTILQPRQELILELATQINQALIQYLSNYKEMMQQLDEGDQAGTGIF